MSDNTVQLIGSIATPVAVLVLVLAFYRPIRDLLGREGAELRTPFFSISSQRAKEALVHASGERAAVPLDDADAQEQVETAAGSVRAHGAVPQVLWVDDTPSNNRYERAALQALGMYVDLATSTAGAVDKVMAHAGYDVIISDMGRPRDRRAGYTLLARLRAAGVHTPYVIYASSSAAEHVDEAVRRGAAGCTNQPAELLDLVSNALRRHGARPG